MCSVCVTGINRCIEMIHWSPVYVFPRSFCLDTLINWTINFQRFQSLKRFLFPLFTFPRGIQQQLSSYRETVIRQATAATGSAVHRDDAPTCGICHKTKFADGCGNLCSYCQTKFCARCGGRVSLRSNTVRENGLQCVLCNASMFSHGQLLLLLLNSSTD